MSEKSEFEKIIEFYQTKPPLLFSQRTQDLIAQSLKEASEKEWERPDYYEFAKAWVNLN